MPIPEKISLDCDDTQFSFTPEFFGYAQSEGYVELGRDTDPGSYMFSERYTEAIYLPEERPVTDEDWEEILHYFFIEASVDVMEPQPGLLEFLEDYRNVFVPVTVTSRDPIHEQVTKELLTKHLADYYKDFDKQLILPEKRYNPNNNTKPSKIQVSKEIGAIALVDDMHRHLLNSNGIHTLIYRNKHTTWNHNEHVEDAHVVSNWYDISDYFVKYRG